uniref:Hexosyltransferase n=1 Tax=Megaselia scalaris TaxID=36166 RepID=T1H463_MEGSC
LKSTTSTTTTTTSAIKVTPKKVEIIKKTDPLKGIPTKHIYEKGHLAFNQQNLCPLSTFNGLDPVVTPQIKLFIFITSAPSHFDARLAIRQTWGNYANRRDISIAYFLGQSRNQTIEDKLDNENELYGDLIRGNFVDSYNNLTLKTISMLEWLDRNCNSPLPKFILKTDDDMFINIPKLLLFIDKHNAEKRTIYGRLAKKWKPIRNKNSKYYVSPSQFSSTVFPHFTTGPAYLLTSDLVHDLYEQCLEETYLKLEDVFTTGIVSKS